MIDDQRLDASTFKLFAYKHYNNPQCVDIDEFYDDLKKFKYLKKLLNKYNETGVFSHRLVLNHIITIYNLFGIDASNKMMEYKIEKQHWPAVNACLRFLGYVKPTETRETDHKVMRILEKI